MTPRACPSCGVFEERSKGQVSLEPISGLCIDCLRKRSRETARAVQIPQVKVFDHRMAAAEGRE